MRDIRAHSQAGPEFKEATEAASRAVALRPDFARARDVLSRSTPAAGDTDRAIEECRLALRADPDDPTALYRLMRASRTTAVGSFIL